MKYIYMAFALISAGLVIFAPNDPDQSTFAIMALLFLILAELRNLNEK